MNNLPEEYLEVYHGLKRIYGGSYTEAGARAHDIYGVIMLRSGTAVLIALIDFIFDKLKESSDEA